MSDATSLTPSSPHQSPFEAIRRTNAAGNEFWSSRDFARVLGYSDDPNVEQVVSKARMACFNSAHRVEDHFVDVNEMIEIGNEQVCAVIRNLAEEDSAPQWRGD